MTVELVRVKSKNKQTKIRLRLYGLQKKKMTSMTNRLINERLYMTSETSNSAPGKHPNAPYRVLNIILNIILQKLDCLFK